MNIARTPLPTVMAAMESLLSTPKRKKQTPPDKPAARVWAEKAVDKSLPRIYYHSGQKKHIHTYTQAKTFLSWLITCEHLSVYGSTRPFEHSSSQPIQSLHTENTRPSSQLRIGQAQHQQPAQHETQRPKLNYKILTGIATFRNELVRICTQYCHLHIHT